MQYNTPKCGACHQDSNRVPVRLVGKVGNIIVSESRKGKPAVTKPLNLYQCTGCKVVYLIPGELQPTMNPLEEIPVEGIQDV